MSDVVCRVAVVDDALPLMALYQTTSWSQQHEPLLLDYRALVEALASPRQCWLVAERAGDLVGVLSVNVDPVEALARIYRLYLCDRHRDDDVVLGRLFSLMNERLRTGTPPVDVVYSTTRTLTMTQLEFTRRVGFRLLGVFPNASGADVARINGIAAQYSDDVLTTRRYRTFELHPAVQPIYALVARHCSLPPMPTAEPDVPDTEYEPLPPLETIDAPRFVASRFARLKERRSLAGGFYPFQEPNALVTDPQQTIEVFVRFLPEHRFAAVIGECVERPVSPVQLYTAVSTLLREAGASYVEVIADAADAVGVEYLLRAGFIACAYVPCLKRYGARRRDFVVLGKPYERLVRPHDVADDYGEFFDTYVGLDGNRFGSSKRT